MTNQNKISSILDMMNDLQENLLALPDDMLLSVDPRDNESLEEGMQFIKAFNTNLQEFSSSSKAIANRKEVHQQPGESTVFTQG